MTQTLELGIKQTWRQQIWEKEHSPDGDMTELREQQTAREKQRHDKGKGQKNKTWRQGGLHRETLITNIGNQMLGETLRGDYSNMMYDKIRLNISQRRLEETI